MTKASDTNSESTDLETPVHESKIKEDVRPTRARVQTSIVAVLLMFLFGMLILSVGIGIVSLKNVDEKDGYDGEYDIDREDDTSFNLRPGYDIDRPRKTPAPSPQVPTPTPTTTNRPSVSMDSFMDALEAHLGQEISDKVLVPGSSQALAFDWLYQEAGNPQTVQRFVLASFYFASGGRLTRATWNQCSAVPTEDRQLDEESALSDVTCVSEGDSHVCAKEEDFIDCPEYYENWDSSPTFPRKRWLSASSECDWYGISCDQEGRVTSISLPGNGLVGELVHELNALENLVYLDLSSNEIGGSFPVLEDLDLTYLSLHGNQMEGQISLSADWMGMRTLDLGGGNRFDVTVDPAFGLVSTLEYLDLGGNVVDNSLPDTYGYNWNKLRHLNFNDCKLSGTLPKGFVGLAILTSLELQNNQIEGTLPDSLWSMVSLRTLRLDNNDFDGFLSFKIGNLRNLRVLSLVNSGLRGNLPFELSNLTNLESASFQHNGFSGMVPTRMCNNLPRLEALEADCDRGMVTCECCTLCCLVGNKDPASCKQQ